MPHLGEVHAAVEILRQAPPGAGVTAHSALTGLAADDHALYHTDGRGDARYSQLAHLHSGVYQPEAAVLTATTAAFTSAQETKLAGVATGATANATDAQLRDRSTHTGTQAAGTITGLAAIATSGAASDLVSGTVAAARLPSFGAGAAGIVPQSGGGTLLYLRADGAWATPIGGGDAWTYTRLVADFTTTSAAAVDITGLSFVPLAGLTYVVEASLLTRTATTTVGPRPGAAWPTGLSDGVANITQTSSATANVTANGNIAAPVLAPVGGLPTTTGSYPASITATFVAGVTPVGSFRLQLASETAGTTVTAKAGSWMRYRVIT